MVLLMELKMLTDDDVASLLGISRRTLINRICLGLPHPPFVHSGNRRRQYIASEVYRWMLNHSYGVNTKVVQKRLAHAKFVANPA